MMLTTTTIRSCSRLLVVGLLFGASALARAQSPAPRVESPGVRVIIAVGIPGPAVALRASLPSTPRVSLNLDLGRVWRSDEALNKLLLGVQANVRADDPRSGLNHGYGLAGVLYVAQPATRTLVQFPNRPPTYLYANVSGWMLQVGYGYDRQSRRGIRAGVEVAGGINAKSGSGAIFVRAIGGWARPARP